jgi:trk system potassium uptake protein TrkA
MNIVIIGAGDIGLHLATLFSKFGYGIILIDHDSQKLEQASRDLDIATRLGSGTDWELLEELLEHSPDILIALTNDDEDNLVACSIAKNLGYPQTIARVRSSKYFRHSHLNFERLFSVDHLIGPEKLTAEAIANMVLIPGSIFTESFSHGAVQMRTIKIPQRWRKNHISLSHREELDLPPQMMVGLIRRTTEKGSKRKEEIIFPHGNDFIFSDDEVTFIGETEAIRDLNKFVGIPFHLPKTVIIVGGSLIGIYLAKSLQGKGIEIRIIEKEHQKCRELSDLLPNATIIHRNALDYAFLESERVGDADFFIACTRNDEVNFLSGSIARHLGCENVIISLSDNHLFPLVSHLGISHAASPRLHAANRILSIAREKSIASMVSMYDNQAEVMEVKVSIDSKIAGIPIRHLGAELPNDFLIVIIQSRGRIIIADGSRVLSPGDTVIVISHPRHVNEIRKLF